MARRKNSQENQRSGWMTGNQFREQQKRQSRANEGFYTYDDFVRRNEAAAQDQEKRRKLNEMITKRQQRIKNEQDTKTWQDLVKNAQWNYGGTVKPEEIYALKMSGVSADVSKIVADKAAHNKQSINDYLYTLQTNQDRTNEWKKLNREATLKGHPEIAYAAKMINDTPVSDENRKKYGSEAKRMEFYDFMRTQGQKAYYPGNQTSFKDASSKDAYKRYEQRLHENEEKKKNGAESTSISDYNSFLRDMDSRIGAGQFDKDDDYRVWSDDRLQQEIDSVSQKISEIKNQSEEERHKKQLEVQEMAKQRGVYTYLDYNGLTDTDDNSTIYWKRPDDYYDNEWYMQHYDEMLYDAIHGRGSYEQRVNDLETDEEAYALDKELSGLWTRLEKKSLHEIPESDLKQRQIEEQLIKDTQFDTRKKEKYLAQLQEMQTARHKMAEMESSKPTGEYDKPEREYSYEGDNPVRFLADRAGGGTQIKDEADKAYWEIQEQKSKWNMLSTEEQLAIIEKLGGNGIPSGLADSFYNTGRAQEQYYAFMTPEMQNTFEQYYLSGDKDSAMSYLEAIKQTGYLDMCSRMFKEYVASENAKGPYGAVYGLTTVLEQPQAGAIGIGAALMNGFEVKKGSLADKLGLHRVESEYDPLLDSQANIRAIRQGRSEWYGEKAEELLGEWAKEPAKFITNVGYSIADNLLAMGVGGAVSNGNIDRCMKVVQWIMSSGATSNTMLNQLEDGKDSTEAALYAIGDGVIEWVTERYSLEQILRPDVRSMLGDWKKVSKYLLKASAAEGSEEIAADLLNMGLDSVLSVVYNHEDELMEKYHALVNGGMDPKEAQKKVWMDKLIQMGYSGLAGAISGFALSGGRVALNAVNQIESGKNVLSDKSGMDSLLKLGMGMKEGTQSRTIAELLNEKVEQGKKPGKMETGKLAQLMMMETGEEQAQVIRDTVHRDVRDSLVERGVDPKKAEQYADAITDSLVEGRSLSKQERSILAENENAMEVWKEYNTPLSTENLKAQLDIVKNTKTQRSLIDTVSELTSKTTRGTGPLAAEIDRSIRETVSAEEAIDNLRTRLPNIISERYAAKAKTILQENQDAKNSKNYLDDVMKVMLAAKTLNPVLPKTRLNTEAAQELYDEAKAEFEEQDKERLVNQVRAVPGQGAAVYDGTEYGTQDWRAKISGMSKTLQNQMTALGEIAVRTGMRMRFINDPKRSGLWGYETHNGELVINLAAKTRNGFSHHMLVTMAHEMTHWLEQNSWEGYNELRNFVLNKLRLKGENIEKNVINTIDNQRAVLGDKKADILDINGAMAEIVARSCENLLSSKAMISELAKVNPSLYNKVKQFVRNFVARVYKALNNTTESLSREALTLRNETEEIANLWLKGRQEALTRKIGEITEGTENEVSFSLEQIGQMNLQELNDEYMQAVKNGDTLTQARMVAEAARRAGYTEKVYHGTRDFGFTQFDMKHSQGAIFATYNINLAQTYTHDAAIRQIKNAVVGDLKQFSNEKLLEAARKVLTDIADEKIDSWELLPDGKFRMKYHDSWYNNKLVQLDYDRRSVEQQIRSKLHNNKQGEGIYQFYADPGRQFVVDAKRSNWDKIKIDDADVAKSLRGIDETVDPKYYEYTTRELVEYAKSRGYDSIRINNVQDKSLYNAKPWNINKGVYGDIVAFFYPQQVKSADPVVYDDSGKVIPLNERFNAGETDIRYSVEQASQRVTRLQNVNNTVLQTINALNSKGPFTTAQIRNALKGIMPHSFEQWLHNKYGNKGGVIVQLSDIIGFINEDNQEIQKGAKSIERGWTKLQNKTIKAEDITNTTIVNDNVTKKIKRLKSELFGKNNHITVNNKSTLSSIRVDNTLLEETFANNNINPNAIEKVLKNVRTLLANAEYIGSHQDYLHKGANVHYYVVPIDINNSARTVMFAVHEATDKQQSFKKRAYVAQIKLVQKNGTTLASWRHLSAAGFTSGVVPEVSIGDVIDVVNDDRFRNYNPEALKDRKLRFSVEQMLDDEYAEAVENKNWAKAEQMLMDKYQQMEDQGLIGYRAVHFNNGTYADIAQKIKSGDPEIIRQAAEDMAPKVPENAVLIPMPPHDGRVTENTDTMLLAKAISEITGSPVINALGSEEHISRKVAKETGNRDVNAEAMGFRQIAEVPENAMPVFIDNMVAGAVTAKAAHDALGRGITLAYAQSARAKIKGAKYLSVTYDTEKNLIPLSERMNPDSKSWKYSVEQNEDSLLQTLQETKKELDNLREQRRALKPETDAWVERITQAQKDGTVDSVLAEYKEWEDSKYNRITNDLYEAEKKYKAANEAFENYLEQRDVAEEQKKIRESGLTEEEWRRKQAIKEFGYTTDFREAGYLLPNGKMLNFTGEKGRHYGTRGQDHRAIGAVYASRQYVGGAAMVKFMSDGNIRIMAETPGVDIFSKTEPTSEQYNAIRQMAQRFAGEEYFNVDFTDEKGNTVDSIEYDGRVSPTKIVNDIKTFYKTGTAPQQSVVSQFHYSLEQSPDAEVNNFMMGLQEFNLGTVQERTMLKQYKELHQTIGILEMKIRDWESRIRKLKAKEKLSAFDRREISKYSDYLNNDRNRLEKMQKELVKVTGTKGYARLMMQQDNLMKNLISGRTAGELNETINAILNELENVNREMAERAARLKELEKKNAVLRIRQQFNLAGLKKIASKLKSDMNSTLENSEIENRLALIALKMKQGSFDQENTAELADLLIGRMRNSYDSYVLSELRGSTITLSKSQLAELKATNRTLRDIQAELAGTGIRVTGKGGTTLDAKWSELCDLIPSLDPNASDKQMLDDLMGVIRSEKRATDTQTYSDENMMATTEMILKAAQQLLPEIVTDEKSLKLIRETLQFVQDVSKQAGESAEAMEDIGQMIDRLKRSGAKAQQQANTLTGDIGETIEYFNTLAEQSEAAMWKKERLALIDQLKSETTQKVMEEQEKWKQKIEKDKAAREKMETNMQLRKRITTDVTRMRKLLINETDIKNIPEHMKGLAREMLRLIVENDMARRKITGIDPKDLADTKRVLDIMEARDGVFTENDLRLIHDEEAQAAVLEALAELEDGIGFYNNRASGDILTNLQAFRNALEKISDAVSTITSVINAERSISFMDRRMDLADAAEDVRKDFGKSRFKGELTGRGSKAINSTKAMLFWGNLTPVYYFKLLRNRGMDMQWGEMQRGENRSGLETQKARAYLFNLAEKTGFADWANETYEVTLGGQKRTITIQNMMELYAIWKREQTINPEMSQHLSKGGVFIQDDTANEGKLRRENNQQRAVRVTDEEIQAIHNQMTDAQKEWMEGIVSYLSNDMSRLGNEASMRMYGIEKYKENYYFPMKVWDGVKSARSDKGITGVTENRATSRSWSKRRMHMAQNALVIGNFTQDAISHIVEMINYNTMGPAIENINKVLNFQFTEGETEEDFTKRNLRIMFQETYGREALRYLEDFMKDLNGGVTQDQRKTLQDITLTLFKKNAVAGSLSVAAQQPLSYIRAAMMISPKYLAQALSPAYWKGSYQEMITHSGVAVIKDMGRFDMNFGQSAKDYITPDVKQSRGRAALSWISDRSTKLPEKMDRMTWTRMWSAVKAEQAAKNPMMDIKSEAFLNMVADRFNQLMRETQVYDSILVKSSNMRSQKMGLKVITSFMAEPTLSLNVLANAIQNTDLPGGKTKVAKAGATFLLSAILQAVVKGLMASGRTPDDKKTWLENFLNKLQYNLQNEANPISLIPGYSRIIELLKTGELQDDAMGAIGKLYTMINTARDAVTGNGRGWYRDLEDTVGQFAQMFTNVPAKNLMRDVRAIRNWIAGDTYAARPTSAAVLKYQAEANLYNGDNLLGTVNAWLGEAGFRTTNKAYYQRIYNAIRKGDEAAAGEMKEYLMLGKGAKEETISSGLNQIAKKDESTSAEEKIDLVGQNSTDKATGDYVTKLLKDGEITAAQARKKLKELYPDKTDDDIWWQVDRIEYKKETGDDSVSGYYYRLTDAMNANKAEKITAAVKDLLAHGVTKDKIKDRLSKWKSLYMEADSAGKVKIRDAITKAYKAAGYTKADADKTITNWTKSKSKKK
jgi:hypothetical protein